MKTCAFNPSDWFNIEPQRSTAARIGQGGFYAAAMAYSRVPDSWAFSLKVDQGLVASAGFIPIIPGVVEVWCATTALALGPNNGLEVARALKGMLESGMEAFGLRRAQAMTEFDDAQTGRLLSLLGFQEETGPQGLRNFLPDGQAVRVFGRVRE